MALIIVDGYNVIRKVGRFLSAEADSLERGRSCLLMEVEELGAKSGHSITVVFDGGGYPDHNERLDHDSFAGVDVIFSRRGRSADDVIVRLIDKKRRIVSGDGSSLDIIVVTDDGALRSDAISRGAFMLSPQVFDEILKGLHPLSY